MKDVLFQEEMIGRQKSRMDWLRYGDNNTNFFQTATLTKRKRNRIVALQDDHGSGLMMLVI